MPQIQGDSKWDCYRTFGKRCFEVCSLLGAVATVIFILLFIGTFSIKSKGYVQIIYIERGKPYLRKTSSKFLSIALDTSLIAEDFHNFNMTDIKLIKMVRYLYPTYLRIGGTLADKLTFNPNLKEPDKNIRNFYRKSSYFYNNILDVHLLPNFTMTGLQWLKLMKFAHHTHAEVLFGINALRRFQNGSWNYSNAESLIKFSNYHRLRLNWELGNEPNSFRYKFKQEVNATQMAEDFAVLRNIFSRYPMYKKSLLVGPDTTRPRDKHKESQIYLQEFLPNATKVINAITWHQYYLNGRTAKTADFVNPEVFDYLKKQITTVNNITKTLKINKPIWLGETSSAYGGGVPNVSNAFIGSFLWVDKLGLSAKMGIDVVMRQSIFKGYYALLDDNYNPYPDWWISILFKRLVGRRVVPNYTATSPKVRLYCHCTRMKTFAPNSPSVTVFGMNMDKHMAYVRIEGLFPVKREAQALSSIYAFELTADRSLCSKRIRLNGKLLEMSSDNSLPEFVPKIVDATSYVSMPPFSIVFWVIPTSYVKACL